jgi:predicted nucleic acid-binding protein
MPDRPLHQAFTDKATRKAYRNKATPLVILDTCVLVDVVCKLLSLPAYAKKNLLAGARTAQEACAIAAVPCPPSLKIFDQVRARSLYLAFSPTLLDEYREILTDAQHMMPRFKETDAAQRLAVLEALLPFGGVVEGRESAIKCADPNDQMLFELAESLVHKGHTDVALVSFDAKVLEAGATATSFAVLHPKDFKAKVLPAQTTRTKKEGPAKPLKPWRAHIR